MLPANYKQIAAQSTQRLRASGAGSSDRKETSPFIHSLHGNPAFAPQKLGKASSTSDTRAIVKPPKAPEKPLMPYMRYSRKVWDNVKAANPELKLWNIGKMIGQMWRELPDSDKQSFIDEYDVEKAQYSEALKQYKSTPEYLAWERNKKKTKASGPDPDAHDAPRSSSKSQSADRRIDIQPAEDEDDQDDGYSFKHVAYARYLRNHRLINEIFSESIVPDVRSVVTTQRMHVLKRQVQSLAMHQMKLQAELQQIEEKFETKKRKFVESSDQFQEELKKHCKPAVDEDAFHKMVERQYELMKRERVRTVDEQVKNPPLKPEEHQPPQPQAPQQQQVSPNANTAQPAQASAGGSPLEQTPSHEPMEVDLPKKAEDIEDIIKPIAVSAIIEKPEPIMSPKPVETLMVEPIVEKVKVELPEPLVEPPAPVVKPVEPEPAVIAQLPLPQQQLQPPHPMQPHAGPPLHLAPPPQLQHTPVAPEPKIEPVNAAPHSGPVSHQPQMAHAAPMPGQPPVSTAVPVSGPPPPASHPEPPISAPNVTVVPQQQPLHQGPPAHHMPPHMAYGNYSGPPRPYYMPPYPAYQGYPPYPPYHHQQYAPQYARGAPMQHYDPQHPPQHGPQQHGPLPPSALDSPHHPSQYGPQGPPPGPGMIPHGMPQQQPPTHPPAAGQEENKGDIKMEDAEKKESSE